MKVLPAGWVKTTLADVADWSSGGTPSRAVASYFDGSIPWIKTGELGPRTIRATEEFISEQGLANSSARVFPTGSVALAMYGATIGKCSILGVPAATNQACAVGTPRAVRTEFLYWYLTSQTNLFTEAGKGGAQPNISQGIVKAWPILLPPWKEQHRITERLEEVFLNLDAGVAELKAAQKKLARYRQSLLKAAVEGDLTAEWRRQNPPKETGAQLLERLMSERREKWESEQVSKFKARGVAIPSNWRSKYDAPSRPDTSSLPDLPRGWCWASLEEVADIQGGIQKQPSRAPLKNKFPFLRVANVARGRLRLDDIHEVELFGDEADRLMLKAGDLLVVEGNGSLTEIGRCAEWDGSIPRAVHQNHLIRVRLVSMNPGFVEAWLNSLGGIDHMTRLAATTSGLYTLSVGKIARIPVPVPPLEEQAQAVSRLRLHAAEVNRQEDYISFALKQAAAQRQNILRAAFSGQLVPQDPNDEPASVLLERLRAGMADRRATRSPRGRKAQAPA